MNLNKSFDDKPIKKIETSEKVDEWFFAITDNGIGIGIGIPTDQQEKIFNNFQRLHGKMNIVEQE